jgi:ubiquitin-conjugating enzyme E2 W
MGTGAQVQLKESADIKQIHGTLPPGITLVSAEGFEEWLLDLRVLDANPIYANQTYRLKFKFSSQYPIGPSRVFISIFNPQATF